MNNFYSKTKEEIFREFNSSANGLNQKEVDFKQEKYGKNVIKQIHKLRPLKIFFEQFNSFLIYILIIAAGVSFFIGHSTDGFVISAIVLLNAFIGFFQQLKAEKAIVNLRKLIDFVYINKSSTKYEFNSPQFFPSFVEIPTYGIYFRGQIKADGKNINYSLDNFYSWNYSKNLAYKNLKEKVNYYTLLQFQTKYFNLYRRILNQSERDYDMDVSLDSPLLD